MTPLHALARRLWPLVDWRRHAVLEARGRRGAAAMLDESMRRTGLLFGAGGATEPDTVLLRSGPIDGARITDVPLCPATGARDCDCYVVAPEPGVPMWSSPKLRTRCTRVEPADGEAVPPPTTRTVARDVLLERAREASQGGADYLPPWKGEGL